MLRGSKFLSSRGSPALSPSIVGETTFPAEILPAAKSTPALSNSRRLPIAPMNPPRPNSRRCFRFVSFISFTFGCQSAIMLFLFFFFLFFVLYLVTRRATHDVVLSHILIMYESRLYIYNLQQLYLCHTFRYRF